MSEVGSKGFPPNGMDFLMLCAQGDGRARMGRAGALFVCFDAILLHGFVCSGYCCVKNGILTTNVRATLDMVSPICML